MKPQWLLNNYCGRPDKARRSPIHSLEKTPPLHRGVGQPHHENTMFSPITVILLLNTLLAIAGCTISKGTNPIIERKNYNPWGNQIGYSQVVKVNNTLYISGIANNATTFEKQIDEIYLTIHNIPTDYNVDTSAIVKQVIYTTDIEEFKCLYPTTRPTHCH